MSEQFKTNTRITLYPSNWLYNAGVVGMMRVMDWIFENEEKLNIRMSKIVTNDGTVVIT